MRPRRFSRPSRRTGFAVPRVRRVSKGKSFPMKKRLVTAIASIALPLSAATLPVRSAVADRPSPGAGSAEARRVLASVLSMDAYRAGVKARTATTSIRSARIPIVPPPVAIDAPKPKPKAVAVRRVPRVARSASRSSARSTTVASGGGWTTIASWYDDRPSACYDKRGRHAFPRGLRIWTAHKTLPCGTALSVTGPSGSVTVRVYDRGPYVAGRALDLSAAAFRSACGSTSRGVCRVTYRVA